MRLPGKKYRSKQKSLRNQRNSLKAPKNLQEKRHKKKILFNQHQLKIELLIPERLWRKKKRVPLTREENLESKKNILQGKVIIVDPNRLCVKITHKYIDFDYKLWDNIEEKIRLRGKLYFSSEIKYASGCLLPPFIYLSLFNTHSLYWLTNECEHHIILKQGRGRVIFFLFWKNRTFFFYIPICWE